MSGTDPRPEGSEADVLVLGAGISGLVAGWALRRQGASVRILEAGAAPGGKIQTLERGGFRFELGPNAVQMSQELLEVFEAARLTDQVVAASDQAKKRFLVHRGQLVAAPTSPREAWSSPLISKRALLRVLTEPVRRRGPGPHESVTRFVGRRLGGEAARLVGAMVQGVYAGDADELAMAHAFPRIYRFEVEHGGLLRGMLAMRKAKKKDFKAGGEASAIPRLCSLRGGLGSLVDRLASDLTIDFGHRVTAVRADGDGFQVKGQSPDGDFEMTTGRLCCAVPIHVAEQVLSGLGATETFARIPHAPVVVLSLGFRRDQVRHPLDGFGFLAPPSEDRMLLGCLFSSTLFPDTAPEGHVSLTVMAGGRRRREDLQLGDKTLMGRVLYELESLLGVSGEPVVSEVTRWEPGIPQATAAMAEVLKAVETMEKDHPGLTVLGDWRSGVGVPACIEAGWNVPRVPTPAVPHTASACS